MPEIFSEIYKSYYTKGFRYSVMEAYHDLHFLWILFRKGITCNQTEHILWKNTRSKVLAKLYFGFFGLFNIMEKIEGEVPERKELLKRLTMMSPLAWDYLRKQCDGHCWSEDNIRKIGNRWVFIDYGHDGTREHNIEKFFENYQTEIERVFSDNPILPN